MSLVSNVILTFSICENDLKIDGKYVFPIMDDINTWLLDHKYDSSFSDDLDSIAGGNKCLETPVFIAAFNYFYVSEFVEFLKTLQWEEPQCVQIFCLTGEDEKFAVFELQ